MCVRVCRGPYLRGANRRTAATQKRKAANGKRRGGRSAKKGRDVVAAAAMVSLVVDKGDVILPADSVEGPSGDIKVVGSKGGNPVKWKKSRNVRSAFCVDLLDPQGALGAITNEYIQMGGLFADRLKVG